MRRTALLFQFLASMVLAFAAGCGRPDEPGSQSQANIINPPGCGYCICGTVCDVQQNTCVIDTSDYCHNGQINPNCETDVDCGGACAERCDDGKVCQINVDCKSGFCVQGKCVDSCHNKQLDPTESDVDCGSGPAGPSNPACPPCADLKGCLADADCVSKFCDESTPLVSIGGRAEKQHLCRSNICGNGTWEPLWESDTDCGNGIDPATGLENPLRTAGGNPCPKCPDGKFAYRHSDCISGFRDPGVGERAIQGSTQKQYVCNSSPCPHPGNKMGVVTSYYMSDVTNRCGDGIDGNGNPRPLPIEGGGPCPRCPTSTVNFGRVDTMNYPAPFWHPWFSTVYSCNQDSDCMSSAGCNSSVAQYMEPGVPSKICYPKIMPGRTNNMVCEPPKGEDFVATPTECKIVNNGSCILDNGETYFNTVDCRNLPPPDMAVPADMTIPKDMTVPPDMTKLPDMTVRPPDMTMPPDLNGVDMRTPYTCPNMVCEVGAGENSGNCCLDCPCFPGMACQNVRQCVIPPDGACRKNARCRLACMGGSRCDNTRNVCTNGNPVNAQQEIAAYNLAYCVTQNFTNHRMELPQCKVGGPVQDQAALCIFQQGQTLDERMAMDHAITDSLVDCDAELLACP